MNEGKRMGPRGPRRGKTCYAVAINAIDERGGGTILIGGWGELQGRFDVVGRGDQ